MPLPRLAPLPGPAAPRRRALPATALAALVVLAALAAALPTPAGAQQRDTTRADSARRSPDQDTVPDELSLPREVAREVVELFNAPGTLRANGSLEIAEDREVRGDVAVLNGPLTVAGRIAGRVVAVNADVVLRPTARIDGDLLVVGGVIEGREDGFVGGEIRVYRQVLRVREEGDRIAVERGEAGDESWWRRRTRRARSWGELRLVSARTYNRVEGLPILLGPSIRQETDWGRVSFDGYGVYRTVENLHWDSENIGHNVRTEVRLGDRPGVAIGGRLFDVVDGVENWHLTDTEVGLASFFLHRDYRDYFDRHGGAGFLSFVAGEDVELSFGLSDERWATRRVRDPFTLSRNQQDWRANPEVDEGRFHVANATLRIDTRNDEADPWSGWYIVADYERGTGRDVLFASRTLEPTDPAAARGDVIYGRGFLDLRRYNRIAPSAQVNLRLVLGGWLDGDPLPLQRRFSLGGPGTLPGFDFRRTLSDEDVNQCSTEESRAALGVIALCERMVLAQLEYRGDLRFDLNLFDNDEDEDDGMRLGWHTDATWVVFADAGRGWLVGERQGDLQYERGQLPSLGTFRTDLGIGLEFYPLGVYLAKSVSGPSQPANFFVRLRRRF